VQGDAILSEAQAIAEVGEDENKYIVFSLGGELYGTKLLSVREVIEAMATKAVPNTIPSFLGVCNLRGQIVGVIDLRIRFGVVAPPAERPIFLVFETSSGLIGAAVDRIVSVSEIPSHQVEAKPNIVCAVPARYIQGIGKWDDRLVTLIDLRDVLSHEELAHTDASRILLKNQEERSA
jgi:purine-binding chemotaxis protein CheW